MRYVITPDAWKAKHRDYKSGNPAQGTACMLALETAGTVLTPVDVMPAYGTVRDADNGRHAGDVFYRTTAGEPATWDVTRDNGAVIAVLRMSGTGYADEAGAQFPTLAAALRGIHGKPVTVTWDSRCGTADPPAGPVCGKCGHGAMRSYGGWGHAPGYSGKRHVVVVTVAAQD